MGASGDKKIGFEPYSDDHRWLIMADSSTSSYETGISLGKGGPLESDADHAATMGRWSSLMGAVAQVKNSGAAMSTVDTVINGFPTQTAGPFPDVVAATWWATHTSAQKTAWVNYIWTKLKHIDF